MGIKLKEANFENFTIFDKGEGPGGVWRDNTYPGAACDIPSNLYSYSFEQRDDWTRRFPEQPEILNYLQSCSEKYGLFEHMRLNTEITHSEFREESSDWLLTTKTGSIFNASIVIFACGQLDRPFVPDLPGIDDFQGALFHSARWDHSIELKGSRVAVIGNGASAIQFVPRVAEIASHLTVFQRSPNWISRKRDRSFSENDLERMRRFPFVKHFLRLFSYLAFEARFSIFLRHSIIGWLTSKYLARYINRRVQSPELREKLRPDFEVGCKRILRSSDWYKTLQLPNVSLESTGAFALSETGVIAGDRTQVGADVVIFATGFDSTNFLAPIRIKGREGAYLHRIWKDGAEAYLGITVAGFPNLFLLYGPNTNLGHNSVIVMIEAQTRYILQALALMDNDGAATLEVRPEAMHLYNQKIVSQAGMARF